MTALYRSGRQPDALQVYQRTRAALAEALGLEPGPALKALQSQILEQDPSLDRSAQPLAVVSARTERDRRSNLPIPLNALIGRGEEMSRALELLTGREVRLLTLWGPGGAGKTRLALEVAAAMVGQYRDGVWIVPLAPIPDRTVMVAEVSRVLEIAPVPGESPEQALLSALARRELLLVLDNFEHLLDAGGVVADLLSAAPRVGVLSTSREPLRIRGEQRMEVPPLLPQDAAELFLARARSVRPDLDVDAEDRTAIGRICERLDGLPLALELAAARVAVFTPRQLETRLAQRLALPEGARDLPERQRTLRATIGWSFQLLDPAERRLLAQLSAVHRRGAARYRRIDVGTRRGREPDLARREELVAAARRPRRRAAVVDARDGQSVRARTSGRRRCGQRSGRPTRRALPGGGGARPRRTCTVRSSACGLTDSKAKMPTFARPSTICAHMRHRRPFG